MHEAEKNIYQLDIPLKGSPLRELHAYLVRGEERGKRSLLIDTGWGDDDCERALWAQLDEIGVAKEELDVFVTHLHVDHSGLAGRLKNENNTIYASETDKEYIDRFQDVGHWAWLLQVNRWAKAPADDSIRPDQHVAYRKRADRLVPIQTVRPGQTLQAGGFSFVVTDLSGHTPGQIGLWNEAGKILFCGDHILGSVSSNITSWDLEHDYVGLYCQNLRRVKELAPAKLYGAHGAPVEDISGRIDELLAHHRARLDEMAAIVRKRGGTATAHDVAREAEWSKGNTFDDLPIAQKWFALSETIAHLHALACEGVLTETQETETEALLYAARA